MGYEIVNYVWIIFQIIIGYNLILPLLLFLLSCLIIEGKKNNSPLEIAEADYAIILTAYEQTDLIPDVVKSILALDYSNYLVYIVADNCDVSNLKFDDNRIIVMRPEQVLASNIGSHFYAIERFRRNHERLTIIDSDNIIHKDFLKELNVFFDKGFRAVQGIRKAKNLDTPYAALDALRDIYYHFYDGTILFKLGSSSTLSGSGMAFETPLYIECLGEYVISGAGFDKVLQYEIVKRDLKIAHTNKAIVLDEKTSRSEQLVKQRSRWIYTWFKYFGYGFRLIRLSFLKQSNNQFLFGITLLRPPLFLFLIMSGVCLLINLWVNQIASIIWIIGVVCFAVGFTIPLAYSSVDKRIYKSITYIPSFIFLQIISLFKAGSTKKSIATTHFHASKPKDNQ